jgi:transposase-like protein
MTVQNISSIYIRKLHALLGSNNENELFLAQEMHMLKTSQTCSSCNRPMLLTRTTKNSLGFRWRCNKPCRREISLLEGSFFDESKLWIE